MTVRCSAVHATEALPALAAAVTVAKAGNPLASVTIIVPTNAVGVTARRWLGANGGVAAIELVTPTRLAERIAGAELASAGRLPVSTPLIDLMVREVLRAAPGDYEPVAEHPSTVTSLRDLHRELRLAGPAAGPLLRGSSRRASEAARVSWMVAERLATDWFDEADLLTLAIERIRGGVELFDRAVAFLPRPDRGLTAGLLAAVAERSDLHVLAEWTGIEEVDAETVAFAEALDGSITPPPGPPPSPSASTLIVSTTDADEEVRHAVRRVVDAARPGTPFARMALVWPTDRPYARLVEHHLDVAGVPWNGRPGTLVTERLVPRFLLDLLQLDRRGLRRNDLFDLLADVPVHASDGSRVSVARWERLARAAGISRDDHWAPRLGRLAASLRAQGPNRERDADEAERLAAFIADLRRDLGHPRSTRTWQAWVEWCERQVVNRLGRSVLDQLDEAERLASDHASRVLDRLRHLDSISRPVTRAEFRAAFAAEFEVAPGRLGRLGDGVTVGSLAGTVGLDSDLTIVLGAADGLLPPAPPTDPLISDTDRRAAGLATSDQRAHRIHRSFLGHLVTAGMAVVSAPRGDLRATTDRLESRWIAQHLPSAARSVVSSHHAGLLKCEFPAIAHEHRLRRRAALAPHGAAALVAACEGDDAALRALRLRAARRSDVLTEFDGDLTGLAIEHFDRPVSASRIESWPSCPHGYFMRYLLGVNPLDDPADELGLSPMERGNVVHQTLDRFHRQVIAGTVPQPGPDGWSPVATKALLDTFERTADEFERSGRTGRAANWFLQRRSVRTELINWFVLDGQLAAERGAEVIHSELRFGYDDNDVTLPLADGRRLAVAGYADRVDRLRDGALVIMDHKSGVATKFKKITGSDPTDGGHKFQLPIYAAAALAAIGEQAGSSVTPVRAEYDFFESGGYHRYGYSFDASVWAHITSDLQDVVDGIESGLFPAVTEPPQYTHRVTCWYCQPDGLGVDERYAEWSIKRYDPRLAPWFGDEQEEASP
jgi:ATP-dependent helicase/nuclease subunit B